MIFPLEAIAQLHYPGYMSVKLLKTDAKGRVSLGRAFANVLVQLEASDEGEWVVRLVEAIPVKEAWLFKNQEALNMVTSGILQAQNREFAPDPRTKEDYAVVD